MNAVDLVANFLHAHPHLTLTLCTLLGLSIVASKLLAPRWPIPPASAKWYVRAAHFVLVNWPAWGVALAGEVKSLVPGASIPFLSFVSRPADSVNKAREILHEPKPEEPKRSGDSGAIHIGLLMVLAAISFTLVLLFGCGGCGPTPGYVRALQIKGQVSDVVLEGHVGWSAARQVMHDNIRTAAPSLEAGLAQLDKVRQVEAKVDAALIVGREAVRKYSEALAEVDAIKRKDWTAAILQVVTAISTMVAALAEFDVHVKWLPPVVSSRPVTQAIWRGYARTMSRAAKCYSFFHGVGGGVVFRQISCEYAALTLSGGAK